MGIETWDVADPKIKFISASEATPCALLAPLFKLCILFQEYWEFLNDFVIDWIVDDDQSVVYSVPTRLEH
jgi:hypothetical protein